MLITWLYTHYLLLAVDEIRDGHVTGVQTCALQISPKAVSARSAGSSAPDSTAAATASSPRATNLSFLATKSVSEFSSTRVPVWPPIPPERNQALKKGI